MTAGSADPLHGVMVVASRRSRRSVGLGALGLGVAAAIAVAKPAEARSVEAPVTPHALRADSPGPRRLTSGAYRVNVPAADGRPAYWALVPPVSREPCTEIGRAHV